MADACEASLRVINMHGHPAHDSAVTELKRSNNSTGAGAVEPHLI